MGWFERGTGEGPGRPGEEGRLELRVSVSRCAVGRAGGWQSCATALQWQHLPTLEALVCHSTVLCGTAHATPHKLILSDHNRRPRTSSKSSSVRAVRTLFAKCTTCAMATFTVHTCACTCGEGAAEAEAAAAAAAAAAPHTHLGVHHAAEGPRDGRAARARHATEHVRVILAHVLELLGRVEPLLVVHLEHVPRPQRAVGRQRVAHHDGRGRLRAAAGEPTAQAQQATVLLRSRKRAQRCDTTGNVRAHKTTRAVRS
eukprot:5291006-Prymnesium_polylepis.1